MPRSLLAGGILVFTLIVSLGGAARLMAQEAPGGAAGITATGHGLASAPAETANLQLIIFSDDFYSGPPQVPQVEATPGTEARATMAPIVEVIEANDSVDSVEVIVPVSIGSLGPPLPIARLDVVVSAPVQEGLAGLLNDVARIASEDRLVIGYVGASFGVADCLTLERQARQAAIEDARSRAETQADVLGVVLGDVIASVDVDTDTSLVSGYYGSMPAASGSCAPPTPLNYRTTYESGPTLPAYDPASQPAVVEVYRQIQLTFAIGEEAAVVR